MIIQKVSKSYSIHNFSFILKNDNKSPKEIQIVNQITILSVLDWFCFGELRVNDFGNITEDLSSHFNIK